MEKLISMIQQDDVVMFVDICQLSKITSEQIYLYERFLEKGINLEFIRNPWLDSENFTVSALEETTNTKRILENVIANTGKAISLDTLMTIHRLKTAALIECAMMIGAILAGADHESVAKVEKIANRVGLAFQIQDDILDVTSTEDVLGKPVGSDEKNEKVTYVSLKGLDQASRDVESYTEEAIGYYDSLNLDNEFLRNLLLSLTSRKK